MVTDVCLNRVCWKKPCRGCAEKGGPGPGGVYWPNDLSFSGKISWCWSASAVADDGAQAWHINFYNGRVFNPNVKDEHAVRCVRR